jgi:hypothetical protein
MAGVKRNHATAVIEVKSLDGVLKSIQAREKI